MTGVTPILEDVIGVPETFAALVSSVLLFIITFLAIYFFGRLVLMPLLTRLLDRQELDNHVKRPLVRISSFLIIFLGIAIAFGIAGFGNFLVAFAGIAAAGTLAVGFALQNVIQNFVAGVFIYLDEPFRIGHWIEWDGRVGVVEDIRLRTTRVRTFDNELLTVPNSELTNNVVKNPVANDTIRQRFSVGIGFEDDVREASEYMIEEAEKHPEILDDPAPSVRLTDLGDSAVILQARFWIAEPERSDFIRIRGEYGANVKRRLLDEGIDIPFPIRTLDGNVAIAEEHELLVD